MKRFCDALLAGMSFSLILLQIPAAQAATEKVVYIFKDVVGEDGNEPYAGVIHLKGLLYGTTYSGGIGKYAWGTVYSVDPKTRVETVLHTFGTTSGDGLFPQAGLIDVKGTLYGTTNLGGTGGCDQGCGTVFAFNPSTGAETVLYSFAGDADGDGPVAGLIEVGGKLYGTTYYGGNGTCVTGNGDGCGTVFSIDPQTGVETMLHAFQSGATDGTYPEAGLIYVNGKLYGTTSTGGASTSCYGNCGTLFAIDPATGVETVVYSFKGGSDGAGPAAGLIDVKGTLYGTTEYGGGGRCTQNIGGCGTVFSFDPKTGAETVLYGFCSQTNCSDGIYPAASLLAVKNTLYGTTSLGGTVSNACKSGCGTAFAIDLATGTETVLWRFDDSDGSTPVAGLTRLKNVLYGTTYYGGNGQGTVFAITP